MPTTTPDNLRYPIDSDPPDIPKDIRQLAEDTQVALSKRVSTAAPPGAPGGYQTGIKAYANDAARTDELTAAGVTPYPGMLTFNSEAGSYQMYWDGKWSYGWFSGLRRDTPIALNTGSENTVLWQTEESRPPLMDPIAWDGGANLIVPISGFYHIDVVGAFQLSSSGSMDVRIYVGGVFVAYGSVFSPAGQISAARSYIHPVSTGQSIQVKVLPHVAMSLTGASIRVTKIGNP